MLTITFRDFVKNTPTQKYDHRPRIVCNSGLSMSVQGGYASYSSPREQATDFSEMEVGFPSVEVSAIMEYAEDGSNPTGTVYGYVPVGVISGVISDNGGIDILKTFDGYAPKTEKLSVVINLMSSLSADSE